MTSPRRWYPRGTRVVPVWYPRGTRVVPGSKSVVPWVPELFLSLFYLA